MRVDGKTGTQIHIWLQEQGVELTRGSCYTWLDRRMRERRGDPRKQLTHLEKATGDHLNRAMALMPEQVRHHPELDACYQLAIQLATNKETTAAQVKALECGVKIQLVQIHGIG